MWKPGPLPPNTWHWGGVVPVGQEVSGFYFADFHGDHVTIVGADTDYGPKILRPEEVALYNNCLELPSNIKGRAGA